MVHVAIWGCILQWFQNNPCKLQKSWYILQSGAASCNGFKTIHASCRSHGTFCSLGLHLAMVSKQSMQVGEVMVHAAIWGCLLQWFQNNPCKLQKSWYILQSGAASGNGFKTIDASCRSHGTFCNLELHLAMVSKQSMQVAEVMVHFAVWGCILQWFQNNRFKLQKSWYILQSGAASCNGFKTIHASFQKSWDILQSGAASCNGFKTIHASFQKSWDILQSGAAFCNGFKTIHASCRSHGTCCNLGLHLAMVSKQSMQVAEVMVHVAIWGCILQWFQNNRCKLQKSWYILQSGAASCNGFKTIHASCRSHGTFCSLGLHLAMVSKQSIQVAEVMVHFAIWSCILQWFQNNPCKFSEVMGHFAIWGCILQWFQNNPCKFSEVMGHFAIWGCILQWFQNNPCKLQKSWYMLQSGAASCNGFKTIHASCRSHGTCCNLGLHLAMVSKQSMQVAEVMVHFAVWGCILQWFQNNPCKLQKSWYILQSGAASCNGFKTVHASCRSLVHVAIWGCILQWFQNNPCKLQKSWYILQSGAASCNGFKTIHASCRSHSTFCNLGLHFAMVSKQSMQVAEVMVHFAVWGCILQWFQNNPCKLQKSWYILQSGAASCNGFKTIHASCRSHSTFCNLGLHFAMVSKQSMQVAEVMVHFAVWGCILQWFQNNPCKLQKSWYIFQSGAASCNGFKTVHASCRSLVHVAIWGCILQWFQNNPCKLQKSLCILQSEAASCNGFKTICASCRSHGTCCNLLLHLAMVSKESIPSMQKVEPSSTSCIRYKPKKVRFTSVRNAKPFSHAKSFKKNFKKILRIRLCPLCLHFCQGNIDADLRAATLIRTVLLSKML